MGGFHISSLREGLSPGEEETGRRANRGVLRKPVIEASLYPKALSYDSKNDSSKNQNTSLPELAFCQALFTSLLNQPPCCFPTFEESGCHREQLRGTVFREVMRDLYLGQRSPKTQGTPQAQKGIFTTQYPSESPKMVTEVQRCGWMVEQKTEESIDEPQMQI